MTLVRVAFVAHQRHFALQEARKFCDEIRLGSQVAVEILEVALVVARLAQLIANMRRRSEPLFMTIFDPAGLKVSSQR